MSYLDVETDAVAFPVLHVNFDGFIYAITVPEILDISPLEYHANINHQGALIKREVINVLGGFDETLRYASDGKLLDSVAKNFTIKLYPEAIVAFVHGGASSSNHKKVWDEIKTYRTPTISISQIHLRTVKTQIRTYFFGRKGDSIIGAVVKVFLRRRFEKIKRNSGKISFYLDLINSLR